MLQLSEDKERIKLREQALDERERSIEEREHEIEAAYKVSVSAAFFLFYVCHIGSRFLFLATSEE